jgi:HNH endonuclease
MSLKETIEQLRTIADDLENALQETGQSLSEDDCKEQLQSPAIVSEIVNYLQPLLTPYEAVYYWYMFNKTIVETKKQNGIFSTRGLRNGVIVPSRGNQADSVPYTQVSVVLKALEEKGAIKKSGEPGRDGTPYRVNLPEEIPVCIEAMKNAAITNEASSTAIDEHKRLDFYNVPENRFRVFERDGYKCYKCGKQLTRFDATLDHLVPVSKGGDNSYSNLSTCCLQCNSKRRNHDLADYMPDT